MAGCLIAPAFAGGYHHKIVNNYYVDRTYVTNVNNVANYTGVSRKDLVTIGAMTGSAAGHQFTRGTKSLQWSVSGSCVDSTADDCGLSGALSQRVGEVLLTGIVSGASDERMIVLSIGGTF